MKTKPITIEEFWEKLSMQPSNNSRDTNLSFAGQLIGSGSAMRMKMEGDELLKSMIDKGEVVL